MESVIEKATLEAASEWFVLLRGEDAVEHQAAFDIWMQQSEQNRRAFAQIEAAFHLGSHLPVASWSRHASVGGPPKRSARKAALAFGLAIGLATVGTVVIAYQRAAGNQAGPEIASRHIQFQTDVGSIKPVRLSDGSVVTLDTQSAVRENFSFEQRDVWLERGRARFDVAHEKRPFVVHVADGTVTAHGTVFDVRIEHGKAIVQLLRGAVDVDLGHRPVAETSHRKLLPGDTVWFDNAVGGIMSSPVTAVQVSQSNWPEAILDVDEISISQLVEEANRYSSRKIRLASPDIGDMKVSGRFRVGDADALSRHLAMLLNLRTSALPGNLIVLGDADSQGGERLGAEKRGLQ